MDQDLKKEITKWKDEAGLRNIERVINTAGHDYWIACSECVKKCPTNRLSGSKA